MIMMILMMMIIMLIVRERVIVIVIVGCPIRSYSADVEGRGPCVEFDERTGPLAGYRTPYT